MTMKKRYYSGICMCGHSWEDHHLNAVLNEDWFKATGESTFPDECEFYGCNEDGGKDEHGEDHCQRYVDKDDPDQEVRNRWKGTVREEAS